MYKCFGMFHSLLNKIKSWLKEKGDKKSELEDEEWPLPVDFTGELNNMNLELRCKDYWVD